jgi:hypothetical protein
MSGEIYMMKNNEVGTMIRVSDGKELYYGSLEFKRQS